MIISVEEAKSLVELSGWSYEKISRKLKAIEQTIRTYTNNNFQKREIRVSACIRDSAFMSESLIPFEAGDTVQVSESRLNEGLFTVAAVPDDLVFKTVEAVKDEDGILVTKVEYPADVVECALNLLEWDVKYRQKVGIQSETLSRHSVTYFAQDASNQVMGYPVSLLGCLKAYKKARF